MNKKYLEEIKKAMLQYNALNIDEKEVADYNNLKTFEAAYNDYVTKCASDKEFVKLYEFIENYNQVVNFDMKDYYQFCFYTTNPEDKEMSDDEFLFDYKMLNNAEYVYNNIEKIEAMYAEKINSLQNGKFVYNREARIEKLKNQLKIFKSRAVQFGELKEKDDLKKAYLTEKANEFETSKKRYIELSEKYAREILENAVKENPEIAVGYKNSMHYALNDKNNNCLYKYNHKVFNDVCNEIRAEALKMIEQEKQSVSEKEPESGMLGG